MLLSEDLQALFDDSLKAIEHLMLEQIENARGKNTDVDKVVLVGGFGDSPALKGHLKASLRKHNEQHRTNIKLILTPPNTSATGVAIGAVMRAQNKDNGPKRVPCRSVGVLRHVPWDPDTYSAEVLAQAFSISDLTQEEYIMRTLLWIIKAVSSFRVIHGTYS